MSELQHSTPAKTRRSPSNIAILVLGLWLGVLVGALVLLVLAVNGVISVSFLSGESADDGETVGKINQPAGEFELQTLEGSTIKLSDLRGKAVVVNFWATWCGPCIREMPMFDDFSRAFPDDLVILGVNVQESESKVNEFVQSMNIGYPILLDLNGKVSKQFQVMALPDTLFIDKNGILRFHHIGILSESQLAGYLAQLGVER